MFELFVMLQDAFVPVSVYLAVILTMCFFVSNEKIRTFLLTSSIFMSLLLPLGLPYIPCVWGNIYDSEVSQVEAIPTLVSVETAPVEAFTSLFDIWIYLYYLWGVIFFALLLRIGLGIGFIYRLQKNSSRLAKVTITAKFEKLSLQVLKKRVPLMVTKEMCSPTVIGIFDPHVVVPQGVIDHLDWPELKLILHHELIHIKRHDNLYIYFQRIMEIVYFFHPLIWLTSRLLSRSREITCDDEVLMSDVVPHLYAKAIYRFLELQIQRNYFLTVGFKDTKIRLQKIVEKRKIMTNKILEHFVHAAVIVFCIGCFLNWGQYQVLAEDQGKQEISEILKTKISCDFKEISLNKAIEIIATLGKVNILISSMFGNNVAIGETKINCKLNNAILRTFLDFISREHGLSYFIKNDVIIITRKQDLEFEKLMRSQPHTMNADEKLMARLQKELLTLSFNKVPLVKVLYSIEKVTGVRVVLDALVLKERVKEELLVEMEVKGLKMLSVLKLLCIPKNLRLSIHGGTVIISLPKTQIKSILDDNTFKEDESQ